ncbi:MAG TPA: enoyl-CoA hydratase/isomerase family protein [Bryobacteraceae bacterium]|nr:enoyl-CoA hydratase/isomerase family protein [Bryobacteraceae bacterium]
MSDLLQSEQNGRVLRLVLNRPEKRNALNFELCRLLVDAIGHANRDPQIGVIVLAGAGDCFSAGMDIGEVQDLRPETIGNVHEQLFTLSARLSKPLIGEVQGAAYGGGVGLVANCHIVLAAEGAKFGLTEIRLGLWPFLVFRAISVALGERRAVELALTGRIFDAAEAKQMGLVQEIARDLPKRAMEVAWQLGEASPSAIRSGLSFVHEVRGKDWEMAGLIARRVREEVFHTGDFNEGIRAFREKRKPKWPSLELQTTGPGGVSLAPHSGPASDEPGNSGRETP